MVDRKTSRPPWVTRREIDSNVADLKDSVFPPSAPQQGANPGKQFLQRERLDEIVVRPGVKASDAVVQGAARGQNQHRRGALLPELRQENESVPVGKHRVEDDQVGVALPQSGARVGDRRRHFRRVSRFLQSLSHEPRQFRLVLDDQNLCHFG